MKHSFSFLATLYRIVLVTVIYLVWVAMIFCICRPICKSLYRMESSLQKQAAKADGLSAMK